MSDQPVKQESRDMPGDAEASSGRLPLIRTKIRIPHRRPDLLPRRRLINFIHGRLDCKLILISAPAGYGKTSLLTDFAHDVDLPVCWYTLDRFDRDLHVFLEHFIAAIAYRFPSFGGRSRAYLRETVDAGRNLYLMVATLVQEIYETIPEYFFLILDDHHTVEDQDQINEFLDLFVTYVDENCHLILSSRTLPVLSNLSLLVARRQAAGLSVDELRFMPQEIQDLAERSYGLELSPEQASQLAQRTGGWITGVLLTAAHRWEQLRSDVPVRGQINIDVYDYLSRQVLERQPAQLRDFLLASSVLNELSVDLCASVLGVSNSVELMEQVKNRNLFVIEFEGEGGGRLRYHDLFKEFLVTTLRQQSQAQFDELMLRAAEAYAARDEWERAVSRYLILQEYNRAAGLVDRIATRMYETGRWDTLAGWIDNLPESVRERYPYLLVQRGKIYAERGEHALALALFEQVEQLFTEAGDQPGVAYALAMKGYTLRFQGRYAEAVTRSREALDLVRGHSPGEKSTMALAHKNTGLSLFRLGQLSQGQKSLEAALGLYEDLGDVYDVASVYHDLGLGDELAGNLDDAVVHYQAALSGWQRLGSPGPWANTLNGLGVVHYLQGEYDEGLEILEEALQKAQRAGDLRVEAYIWASMGDLHRDLSRYGPARQAYTQALEIANRTGAGFILTYAMNGLGNTDRLQGQHRQAGKQLRRAMELATRHGSDYESGLCHVSLGVLAYEREDLATARFHLDQAIRLFQGGGFHRDLALAYFHRAQTAFLGGDEKKATLDLTRSLELVDQLGFVQFLVVEGVRLPNLMRYAEKQGIRAGVLGRILEQMEAHRKHVAPQKEAEVQTESRPVLQIYALGQPQVEVDGQGVQWTTVQSRDLFFCLLQHAQGLRKEEIGGMFWPDHPPHKLDGIFRSTLYRLRRATFRESVLFRDGLYCANPDIAYWFDVQAFEKLLNQVDREVASKTKVALLEEALTLYQGDYLEEVYADWCALERERLRERHFGAVKMLAGLYADRGDLQQAIEKYQGLIVLDPYREGVYRQLMWCHYRLGDRVTAIRQYHTCVQILREDLGLSPSPETEELYLQIIR